MPIAMGQHSQGQNASSSSSGMCPGCAKEVDGARMVRNVASVSRSGRRKERRIGRKCGLLGKLLGGWISACLGQNVPKQAQLSVAQAFLPVKTCPKACFSSFGEDLRSKLLTKTSSERNKLANERSEFFHSLRSLHLRLTSAVNGNAGVSI